MKSFDDFKVYVFDVDGTLYDQRKLRIIMALRLAIYYGVHFYKLRELLWLRDFRRLKEHWDESDDYLVATDEVVDITLEDGEVNAGLIDNLDAKVCAKLASEKGTDSDRIESIVRKWIYDNPLTAIAKTKDEALIDVMKELRSNGRKVVILSDYPAVDKIKSLQTEVDGIYTTTDKGIGELKPSPKGLHRICSDFNVTNEDIIMIGDRLEKDGMCARNAGAHYIILDRNVNKRKLLRQETIQS